MATIFSLIAEKILAANPARYVPTFVAAPIDNGHVLNVTNPQGTYYSNMALEAPKDSPIPSIPVYRQQWASNTGIMMKTVGADKSDNLYAGDGSDVVMGDSGKDTVVGGHGDDLIIGGGGDDMLYGQFGNNTIVAGYRMADNSGTYFLDSWKGLFSGSMTYDDIASKFIPMSGNAYATGADGKDIILSGAGNDKIVGLGGDDTLFSGAGDDLVVGDSYNGLQGWGSMQTGNDYIDAGAGNDTVMGGAGNDTILGGDGDDLIWGDTDPAEETGVADTGNDLISAGAGADTVYGGAGNDTIYGDAGNDVLYGDAGNDTIYGGADSDALHGGDGADVLYGDAGNDVLYGDGGNDVLYGGTGNDIYVFEGQFGNDAVVEYANAGTDDRVVFNNITVDQVQLGRSGNDLMLGSPDLANTVAIKDWFTNFGVDSVWFATGTAGQYNYVTAQGLASLFGVTIPASGSSAAASNTLAASAVMHEATVADSAPASHDGFVAGSSLSGVLVEVTGVDMHVDAAAVC